MRWNAFSHSTHDGGTRPRGWKFKGGKKWMWIREKTRNEVQQPLVLAHSIRFIFTLTLPTLSSMVTLGGWFIVFVKWSVCVSAPFFCLVWWDALGFFVPPNLFLLLTTAHRFDRSTHTTHESDWIQLTPTAISLTHLTEKESRKWENGWKRHFHFCVITKTAIGIAENEILQRKFFSQSIHHLRLAENLKCALEEKLNWKIRKLISPSRNCNYFAGQHHESLAGYVWSELGKEKKSKQIIKRTKARAGTINFFQLFSVRPKKRERASECPWKRKRGKKSEKRSEKREKITCW